MYVLYSIARMHLSQFKKFKRLSIAKKKKLIKMVSAINSSLYNFKVNIRRIIA